jgi:serine/threonine protein kinase
MGKSSKSSKKDKAVTTPTSPVTLLGRTPIPALDSLGTPEKAKPKKSGSEENAGSNGGSKATKRRKGVKRSSSKRTRNRETRTSSTSSSSRAKGSHRGSSSRGSSSRGRADSKDKDSDDKEKRRRRRRSRTPSSAPSPGGKHPAAPTLTLDMLDKGARLGKGSEGVVYLGRNRKTGELLAIKEARGEDSLGDVQEEVVYQALYEGVERLPPPGFPMVYWSGVHDGKRMMVMELLGPSLKDILPRWSRRHFLPPAVVAKVAVQAIRALEHIHDRGWLWIDAKPQNICLAQSGTPGAAVVKIVDFGVSKRYIDEGTTRHKPQKSNHHVTGSVPYISVGNHQGFQPSRRDDIESLSYVLLFLLRGKLPWRDLPVDTTDRRRVHKYARIGRAKAKANPDILFYEYPSCFSRLLRTARAMAFTEAPDYRRLVAMFEKEIPGGDLLIREEELPREGRPIFHHWARTGYYKEPPGGRDDSSASYSSESSSSSSESSSSDSSDSSSSSSSS